MKKILRECIRLAREKTKSHNKKVRHRHFSFVIQGKKILARGVNIPSNPPKELGFSNHQGIHSEIDAYRKAKGILDHEKSFTIVNIRINKRGILRNSMPCKQCYDFLKYCGAHVIYFSTNYGFARIKI